MRYQTRTERTKGKLDIEAVFLTKGQTAQRKADEKRERAKLPKVMFGFPKDMVLHTKDETDAYFDHDKLTCFECGHSFRKLAMHLRLAHAIYAEDYKRQHGLPFSAGLLGRNTRNVCHVRAKNRMEEGTFAINGTPEQAALARASKKGNRTEATNKLSAEHFALFWQKARRKRVVKSLLKAYQDNSLALGLADLNLPKDLIQQVMVYMARQINGGGSV